LHTGKTDSGAGKLAKWRPKQGLAAIRQGLLGDDIQPLSGLRLFLFFAADWIGG
jgi:hypothetical protein